MNQIQEFTYRQANDVIFELNRLNGKRYLVMMDESAILLFDKVISKPIIIYHQPSSKFNHFFSEVRRLDNAINQCRLYYLRIDRNPNDRLETQWFYKRLKNYYTDTQIYILLYGKE